LIGAGDSELGQPEQVTQIAIGLMAPGGQLAVEIGEGVEHAVDVEQQKRSLVHLLSLPSGSDGFEVAHGERRRLPRAKLGEKPENAPASQLPGFCPTDRQQACWSGRVRVRLQAPR